MMKHAPVMAEFDQPEALVDALRALSGAGLHRLDAYTPYPIPAAQQALGLARSRVAWWAFAAGLTGAAFAYAVQWWTNVHDYPVNEGGRPMSAPLAWIPIIFETTVLFAAATALLAVFAAARLPRLWHPVFEVEGFQRASIDRFWLSVDPQEPGFDAAAVDRILARFRPLRVVWPAEAAP